MDENGTPSGDQVVVSDDNAGVIKVSRCVHRVIGCTQYFFAAPSSRCSQQDRRRRDHTASSQCTQRNDGE